MIQKEICAWIVNNMRLLFRIATFLHRTQEKIKIFNWKSDVSDEKIKKK